MAAKKLTRKQLLKEPDKFLNRSSRLFMFIMERKWHFLGAIGILILIAAVGSGMHYFSKRNQDSAFALLAEIQSGYKADIAQGEPEAVLSKYQPMFDELLEKHGERLAGKAGRIAYANAAFAGGDYPKAIELYQQGLSEWPPDSTNHQLVLYGMGHAFKSSGNLEEALDAFTKLAASSASGLKPEAYYYLAQIHQAKSDKTAQVEALRKILSDYPDFIFMDMVKAQLADAG